MLPRGTAPAGATVTGEQERRRNGNQTEAALGPSLVTACRDVATCEDGQEDGPLLLLPPRLPDQAGVEAAVLRLGEQTQREHPRVSKVGVEQPRGRLMGGAGKARAAVGGEEQLPVVLAGQLHHPVDGDGASVHRGGAVQGDGRAGSGHHHVVPD